jgi:hypothetical protein
MAGQIIPKDDLLEIFENKTPIVIGAADSVKNLGESNISSTEGGAKLVSGTTGLLGVPVGMAELSSSLIGGQV